ncbi:MAG: AtpZ/AtpI family protein [Thermodesulforhabdaceae bacterium]|jgi:ATP synthase protein I
MKKETKQYIKQVTRASTVGLSIVFAIFIGLGIGYWLDTRLGTGPWLTMIFLGFGIVAGFRNYYRFAKKQRQEYEQEKESGGNR